MRSGLTHLRNRPQVPFTYFDLGAELFGDLSDEIEMFEPVTTSELDEPCWSVVSFSRQEADGLTHRQADELLTILETYKVRGLCIVTDEAAKRIKP